MLFIYSTTHIRVKVYFRQGAQATHGCLRARRPEALRRGLPAGESRRAFRAAFGERVARLGLSAPDAGVIRIIASNPGISQQALAAHLGVLPSRMVALVDSLEEKGIVERRRSATDRRNYALALTERGGRSSASFLTLPPNTRKVFARR